MIEAGCTNDHSIALLGTQQAMVRDPTERNFRQCQLMGIRNGLNGLQGLEVMFVPVPIRMSRKDSTLS